MHSLRDRPGFASAGIFLLLAAIASGQVALRPPSNAQIQTDVSNAVPDDVSAWSPNDAPETERLIIIGSNIPTADQVGANPVLTINRERIDQSGERTAEELIKNLPEANARGVPLSNDATGFTPGASSISLRGFSPSATLVLIDGRRVAPYPVGADGTDSFMDLNSIPGAAIESIEVLKDGASVIYGADAVAGVVNIKFRHDYHGAEAKLEYGNTLDKDSSEYSSSLLFGVGDEVTQVTGVANFYHRNSIAFRDRGFSAKPPFLSSNASPYNLSLSRGAVVAAIQADNSITPDQQGALIAGLPTDSGGQPLEDFYGHAPFGTNGTAPVSQFAFTSRRSVRFNFNQFALSFPDTERYGGFVSAAHKVWADQLVVYADLFYQNVQTHTELAPSATGPFLAVGSTILAIPPQHPVDAINPATGQPYGVEGGLSAAKVSAPAGAYNPFNPFQQFISGGTSARLAEFGNRLINNETDAFMTTLGLKGDRLFDGTWGYDIGFRYSQIRNTATGTFVSGVLFDRILNANDPIFDPGSSQYIGTSIPFNPFTDYRVPFASNLATVDFATVHPRDVDTSKLGTLDATVYTTDLFKLPAGGVGLALGAQFRREAIEQDIDLLENGDIVGTSQTASTRAGRKSYGIYLETDLPLFSATNAIPAFHALSFTAAARYEAFRSNDTNVLVPKFGMRWQPLDDSLTIRSTWGEGFLQPTLFQLFGSSFSFFGGQNGDIPVTVTSNPLLQPEDSRNFNAGFVYSPKFVPGLTLSCDLWDIERKGVAYLPFTEDVITRDENGALLPGEAVLRDPSGEVTRVIDTYQNGGSERARGVDLGLQYQIETRFGTFTSLTQVTYLDSFRQALTANAPALEVSNTGINGSADAFLKWRGISRLDWRWKGLDIVATARYFDGFHEILFHDPDFPDGKKEHWVDHTWFFDVQASYYFVTTEGVGARRLGGWKQWLSNSSLTVGCNNVFGQDPPKAYGEFEQFLRLSRLHLRRHRPLSLRHPEEGFLTAVKNQDASATSRNAGSLAADPRWDRPSGTATARRGQARRRRQPLVFACRAGKKQSSCSQETREGPYAGHVT
jgi:iron complex outermembrane recepter protein